MNKDFPQYEDVFYYDREKLYRECLPYLEIFSEEICDYHSFFDGKKVSMLGFPTEKKVWLRKFILLNGGRAYHKSLDDPDIIVFGDGLCYHDMLQAYTCQQSGGSLILLNYDTFISSIDTTWYQRVEEHDQEEAEKREKRKEMSEATYCDEEFLSKLNWVGTSALSLFEDTFYICGRLTGYDYIGATDRSSKNNLYEHIRDKFGQTSIKPNDSVTCVIVGDWVPRSSLIGLRDSVKYIKYLDFQLWLSDATPAYPEFFEFREKYASTSDNRLRTYQQIAKDAIFSTWRSEKSVMLQMPTGAGKTMLFSSVIKDIVKVPRSKILIIAHRSELIDQIDEHLNKYGVEHGIIASSRTRNLERKVQIASIQTLTHKNNEKITKEFTPDFIIIDEAHHSLANTYNRLWILYPRAWKLGVTATPCRLNCAPFTANFSKLIESLSILKMIEQGYLSDYVYYTENPDSSLSKAIESIKEKSSTGDYRIADLLRNLNVEEHIRKLILSYNQYAKGLKGIVYAISIEHATNICAAYKEIGVLAEFIDSKTPKNERERIVQSFKSGAIQVMVNVDIFSEGFDCPDVEFIQMARPTWSLSKFMQQVGRGLRKSPGKERTIILDNAGMFARFGLPSDNRIWSSMFSGDDVRGNYVDNINVANSYLRSRYRYSSDLMLRLDREDIEKYLRSDSDHQEQMSEYQVGISQVTVSEEYTYKQKPVTIAGCTPHPNNTANNMPLKEYSYRQKKVNLPSNTPLPHTETHQQQNVGKNRGYDPAKLSKARNYGSVLSVVIAFISALYISIRITSGMNWFFNELVGIPVFMISGFLIWFFSTWIIDNTIIRHFESKSKKSRK